MRSKPRSSHDRPVENPKKRLDPRKFPIVSSIKPTTKKKGKDE